MIKGYVAKTTSVILQFKIKAIINEVTTKPTFCKRIVERSTTIVCNKVASVSKRAERTELVLLVSSNQPISFFKIAATHEKVKLSEKEII